MITFYAQHLEYSPVDMSSVCTDNFHEYSYKFHCVPCNDAPFHIRWCLGNFARPHSIDNLPDKHIDTIQAYFHKCPYINYTLYALHIRQCHRTFDCSHSNWIQNHNHTDMNPKNWCIVAHTNRIHPYIRQCPHRLYRLGWLFWIRPNIRNDTNRPSLSIPYSLDTLDLCTNHIRWCPHNDDLLACDREDNCMYIRPVCFGTFDRIHSELHRWHIRQYLCTKCN